MAHRDDPVMQSQAIGYDGVADVLTTHDAFCNAVGVHETFTAGLTVTSLSLVRSYVVVNV